MICLVINWSRPLSKLLRSRLRKCCRGGSSGQWGICAINEVNALVRAYCPRELKSEPQGDGSSPQWHPYFYEAVIPQDAASEMSSSFQMLLVGLTRCVLLPRTAEDETPPSTHTHKHTNLYFSTLWPGGGKTSSKLTLSNPSSCECHPRCICPLFVAVLCEWIYCQHPPEISPWVT